MDLVLRKLESTDQEAFLRGFAAWDGEDPDWYSFDYRPGMAFADLLVRLSQIEVLTPDPQGKVPATMLYGFVNGEIVGRISIRHVLNDNLRQRGGHIGWAVAPQYRRRGYALAMVKQAIPIMRDLGISRALITCASTNAASKRIMAIIGAQLGDVVQAEELVERYWLDLSPVAKSGLSLLERD